MGTGAFFQGFPVVGLALNRARGLEGTPSTLELVIPEWDTLQVCAPGLGEAIKLPAKAQDLELARDAALGRLTALPDSPASLGWSGWLAFCEADRAGRKWGPHELPLWVVRVASVRRSNLGRITRVRLVVSDQRYWSGLGALQRWSFNRKRADGLEARDARLPNGGRYSQEGVLRETAGALGGAPAVARVPARLKDAAGPVELPAGAPARDGLQALLLRFGLSDPCLQWDGRLAFYDRGEGRIAYSPDGTTENSAELEPAYFADRSGAGYGREVEFGYPPDYVRVIGSRRIASVAVDRWERVLHLPVTLVREQDSPAQPAEEGGPSGPSGGRRYFELTEDLLRRLVPGDKPPGGAATWTDWLHVWLLGPRSHQGIPGLSREVAELLAAQAERMLRLPGVVRSDGLPGPNAHLLPLLPRAEAVDGRRQPVTVETFAFRPMHWQFQGTAQAEIGKLRQALDQLRKEILDRELAKPVALIGGLGDAGQGGPGREGDRPLTGSEVGTLLGSAVDPLLWEGFNAAIREARFVDRATVADPSLASLYEQILTKLYAEQGGHRQLVYDFARDVLKFEDELRSSKLVRTLRDQIFERPELLASLRRQAETMSRQALNLERERQLASRTGASASPRGHTATFYENLERSADPGARVYDADAGVILTSRLPGWLVNPAVATPLASSYVPKDVRVVFGATLRPRVDLLPGEAAPPPRPRTGEGSPDAPGDGGSGDQIPAVLTDAETLYVATFRRGAAGPEVQADDAAVAAMALPVVHRELAELVPLVGEGNRADLDRQAAEIARGAMDRPTLVSERRVTLCGPWLVQTDGLVSGVQIVMRPNLGGFLTVVEIGSQRPSFAPLRTQERRKPPERGTPDSLLREGLA